MDYSTRETKRHMIVFDYNYKYDVRVIYNNTQGNITRLGNHMRKTFYKFRTWIERGIRMVNDIDWSLWLEYILNGYEKIISYIILRIGEPLTYKSACETVPCKTVAYEPIPEYDI